MKWFTENKKWTEKMSREEQLGINREGFTETAPFRQKPEL